MSAPSPEPPPAGEPPGSVASEVDPLAAALAMRVSERRPCLLALSVPPELRQEALGRLRAQLAEEELGLQILEIPLSPPASLAEWLLETVSPATPAAVILLHRALPEGARSLNLLRDKLRDRRLALIFVLTPEEMGDLATLAPDLWRYLHGFGAVRSGAPRAQLAWPPPPQRYTTPPPSERQLKRWWKRWDQLRVEAEVSDAALEVAKELSEGLSAAGDVEGMRRAAQQLAEVAARAQGVLRAYLLDVRGDLLVQLGEAKEARDTYEEVASLLTKALGPRHPDVLTAIQNRAEALKALGDLSGALDLQSIAVEGLAATLGPEHPATLVARGNLAETLLQRGEPVEARERLHAVHEAMERLLGADDGRTVSVRSTLASAYGALGELDLALDLMKGAWDVCRRRLGPDHPKTLTLRNNLAQILITRGELASARAHLEASLAEATRNFEADHPLVLTLRSNLAGALLAQGELEGAREIQQSVWEGACRRLGPGHPKTLIYRGNLAYTQFLLGNLEAAEEHQRVILNVRSNLLGPEHPETMHAAWGLLMTLSARGALDEVGPLSELVAALLAADPSSLNPLERRLSKILKARPLSPPDPPT